MATSGPVVVPPPPFFLRRGSVGGPPPDTPILRLGGLGFGVWEMSRKSALLKSGRLVVVVGTFLHF